MKVILKFAMLAVLYTINNNLITHIQVFMDPASFQLLNNLKIVSTAICFRIVMKKELSNRKWAAITLLFLAGLVNSIGGLTTDQKSPRDMFVTVTGLVLVVIYCSISAIAGVFTELMLKQSMNTSVHVQNLYLYSFGLLINWTMMLVNVYKSDFDAHASVFQGFTYWTWFIVLTQASNGVLISIVMKFRSNLSRLFIMGAAMVMTSVMSYLVFGYHLNVSFSLASVCVFVALYLNHYDA